MAVAGLVLGIISIVLSFIPVVNVLGMILALLGAIFGGIGIKDSASRGKAITGLVLSVLALCIAFCMYGAAYTYFGI